MRKNMIPKIMTTCGIINVLGGFLLLMFCIIDIFNCSDNIEEQERISSENVYNITEEERDMLASLCTLEASVCSEDCQRAVVSVIFNRLNSCKWNEDINGDGKITLYDIVYYPNAFTPAHLIGSAENTKEAYEAVDYVLKHGSTVPEYVRYFRTSKDFSWVDYKNYCTIDNVYFGYFTTWQKGVW